LVELNVIEQVVNVCQTTAVQDAWARNQDLTIHGWIYAVNDGLLRDLRISTADEAQLSANYERALAGLRNGVRLG
jgi:carbonic anhydrase